MVCPTPNVDCLHPLATYQDNALPSLSLPPPSIQIHLFNFALHYKKKSTTRRNDLVIVCHNEIARNDVLKAYSLQAPSLFSGISQATSSAAIAAVSGALGAEPPPHLLSHPYIPAFSRARLPTDARSNSFIYTILASPGWLCVYV